MQYAYKRDKQRLVITSIMNVNPELENLFRVLFSYNKPLNITEYY